MNIKIKAGLIVGAILTAIGLTMIGLQLAFAYIPIEILGKIGALIIIGGLVSLLYSMVLDTLKREEKYQTKLKEMVDQKSK